MKIDQFLLLSDPEKEETIWEEGNFLATYDKENMMYDVYQLFDFFVTFSYAINNNEKVVITVNSQYNVLPVKNLAS